MPKLSSKSTATPVDADFYTFLQDQGDGTFLIKKVSHAELETMFGSDATAEGNSQVDALTTLRGMKEAISVIPLKHNLEMFEAATAQSGADLHTSKIYYSGSAFNLYYTKAQPYSVFGRTAATIRGTWSDLNTGSAILSASEAWEDASYGIPTLIYTQPVASGDYVGFYQYIRDPEGDVWTGKATSSDGLTWTGKTACTFNLDAVGFPNNGIGIVDVVFDYANDEYVGLFHAKRKATASGSTTGYIGLIGTSDDGVAWTITQVLPTYNNFRRGTTPLGDTDVHCLLRVGSVWLVMFQSHYQGGEVDGGWMFAFDVEGPWFVSPHRTFKRGTPNRPNENGRYPHAVHHHGVLTFCHIPNDGGSDKIRVGEVSLEPPFVAERVNHTASIAAAATVANAGWVDLQGAEKIAMRVQGDLPAGGTGSLKVNLLGSADNSNFDTSPYATLEVGAGSAATQAKTFAVEAGPKFTRFELVNDTSGAVTNVTVEVMME